MRGPAEVLAFKAVGNDTLRDGYRRKTTHDRTTPLVGLTSDNWSDIGQRAAMGARGAQTAVGSTAAALVSVRLTIIHSAERLPYSFGRRQCLRLPRQPC